MKLVVAERESMPLLEAIEGRGPFVSSVVGEIETVRASLRVGVPAAQLEELRRGLVLVALDEDVRNLAARVRSPAMRTLDAIHLATALTLGEDLHAIVTYDARLAEAIEAAGMPLLSPQ